jgi:hypothetical protein
MSDRKKQIECACDDQLTRSDSPESAFILGAEWADSNPAPTQSGEDEQMESLAPDFDGELEQALKRGGKVYADAYVEGLKDAWECVKAVRKGMVPKDHYTLIDEARGHWQTKACQLERDLASEVEKAVKAERMRIESMVADGHFLSDILYPAPTGESGEGVL